MKLKENQKLQLEDGSWIETDVGDSIKEAREITDSFSDTLPSKLEDVVKSYKLKTKRMIRAVADILESWYELEGMEPLEIEEMTTKEFRRDILDLLNAADLTEDRQTVIAFLEVEDLFTDDE